MDHVNDIITVWKRLIAHYGDDVAAEERSAQIFENPLPVAVRLQNYLSNTITLDSDRKKSTLTSRRHANLGMICSGDVDISEFLDTDVHVAQAISDGGYNNTGTTTFDINAAAY
eukprot:scaffold23451_cov101-Skeletonema_dohrnii-CCMP3373.AAC.1